MHTFSPWIGNKVQLVLGIITIWKQVLLLKEELIFHLKIGILLEGVNCEVAIYLNDKRLLVIRTLGIYSSEYHKSGVSIGSSQLNNTKLAEVKRWFLYLNAFPYGC